MTKIHLKIKGKENARQVKSSQKKVKKYLCNLIQMVKDYTTGKNKFLQNILHLLKKSARNWIQMTFFFKKQIYHGFLENTIQQIWSSKKPQRVKENS